MTAFFFAAGEQNVLKEVVNLNDNVTSTCRWVGHPWNIASICQDPRSSQAWWTQNYTLRFKQLDNLLSAHWLSLQVTALIICCLCEWPAFLKVEVTVFIEVTIIPFVAKLICLWNLQENCYRHLLNAFLSAELAVFSRIARRSFFFCAWYLQKLTLKRLLPYRYYSTDPISPLVFLKQIFKHWNSCCASVLFLANLIHVQGQLTTRPPWYRNHNLKSWLICYVTKLGALELDQFCFIVIQLVLRLQKKKYSFLSVL